MVSRRSDDRRWLCICAALFCGLLAGCSSSNSKTVPPPTLQFVTPTASPTLDPGQTVSLTVNESATWSLQSGCGNGKAQGTFTGGAKTATGTTATYVAPATSSNCNQDVVVASAGSAIASIAVFLSGSWPSFTPGAFSYNGPACSQGIASPMFILPGTPATSKAGAFTSIGPLAAQGGAPPYTWTLVSTAGSPNSLQLSVSSDTTQAILSGTPASAGCSTMTLELADSTAPSNCAPTNGAGSSPCMEQTINLVVIPASPKIQVPNYPSALNDPVSGQGAPYPATALVASGGQAPYFWCQSPPQEGLAGSTLPPGLQLNSTAQSNFNCPNTPGSGSAVQTSGQAVVSGVPSNGNEATENSYCHGQGAGPGCYTTQFEVYDSQSPYPAVTFVTLGGMTDLPINACSQANQAPLLGGSTNPDAYLTGPVAFLLRGFDASKSAVVIAGSVTLDGAGKVTGGTVDVTRSSGHQQLTIPANSGSWYVVGASSFGSGQFGFGPANLFDYSRGCMSLALVDSANTPVPMAFSFTLGGCTNHYTEGQVTATYDNACGRSNNQPLGTYTTGRIIEFDDNTGNGTRASGILRVQDATSFAAGLSGPYAFGMSGGDSAQQHYAVAGSFQASSGNITSAAGDVDDGATCGATPPCNVTITGGPGGQYTADSVYGTTNGRWTGALSLNSSNSFTLAVYAVSKNEVLVATMDPLTSTHPIAGGEAITSATSFSAASLENSHIFHIGGLSTSGPDVSVGVLNFDGVGSVTGTVYEDQAATLGTTALSGAYQVDPNTGRVLFAAPGNGQTLGAHPFVAYMIPLAVNLTHTACSAPANCVSGFLVGTDNTAQSGIMEFQTPAVAPPPPFSNLYVAGNYAFGTDESLDTLTANAEGDVYATPSSTSTTSGTLGATGLPTPFLQDVSYGDTSYYCPAGTCYLLQPNQAVSGAYVVNSNGTGNLGGGVVSVTNGNVIFYIDESPVNQHPTVMVAEQ